jgi:fructose-bisphosphate aldolase class II
MKTLREYIHDARENGIAIGHFNISNLEALKGIVGAAMKLNVPVVIGVSEGERDFVGVHQAAALIKSLRENFNHPIFLNADHSYSFERVKEAVEAGFDMVIIDNAKLPLEENISVTRRVVEYVKGYNNEYNKDILVESELGYIGSSSKVLDSVPEGVGDLSHMTTSEDAARFVRETGIDLFSPAVGNIHGMVIGGNPKLNIGRISEISSSAGVPLVLHGASGIGNDELKAAVEAGISMVHYNTELRVAYKDALKKSLEENPQEVAPYKILASSVDAVEKVVEEKLRIMNRL